MRSNSKAAPLPDESIVPYGGFRLSGRSGSLRGVPVSP
ncbi:hypothetical protein F8B43_3009 [Methylorubrum populi]|uniref:Uncharacterized protein n=1 Tax=Methylorubrum populi TaxID=223967 RepID=A0A833MZ29_9HYPH|nr:hypothetical protein F8B43_3009 [Methylorubrum populi]